MRRSSRDRIRKPSEQRAKASLLFIRIALVLEIVSMASSILQYNLLQTIANGSEITSQAADANDMLEFVIAVIYLIVPGQILFRVARDIDTMEGSMSSKVLDMVSSGIGIIPALMTVRVIKNYSDVEVFLNTERK